MKNSTLIYTITITYLFLLSLIFKNINDINTLKEKLELSHKNIASAATNYQHAADYRCVNTQIYSKRLMDEQKINNSIAKNKSILKISSSSANNNTIKMISSPDTKSVKTASYSIGDLFVLDNLFDNDHKTIGNSVAINTTDLGDLFVLNALFNKHEFNSPLNQYDIGDLFVLDNLFNFNNKDLLDSGASSLKDLLILDQLFNK